MITPSLRRDAEALIREQLAAEKPGLSIASQLSVQFNIDFKIACREVNRLEMNLRQNPVLTQKTSEQFVQRLLAQVKLGVIELIIELGDTGLSTLLNNKYPESRFIGVRTSVATNVQTDLHVQTPVNIQKRIVPNRYFVQANPWLLALSFHDPAVAVPVDLLLINCLLTNLEATCTQWLLHMREGGAIIFTNLASNPALQNFFLQLRGGRKTLNGPHGIWVKVDTSPKPTPSYVDSMKRQLMNSPYESRGLAYDKVLGLLQGNGWPSHADTMIGRLRLEALQYCIEQVLKDQVPGDFIETGVWRGGASIFMRALLAEADDKHRTVWLADSFAGLPPPDPEKYPADKGLHFEVFESLAVSLNDVKANFARYKLLDNQVQFLEGWFSETLPDAPIDQLAILRLDGDLYESTMDALSHLYPKLTVGGYIIIDDYGGLAACRQAVTDYRQANNINDEIELIDWTGVYWRKC